MEIPKLEENKYSLIFAENSTGHILNSDLTIYNKNLDKSPIRIFNNFDLVEFFAMEFILENPKIECIIYDDEGRFVKLIDIEVVEKQKRIESISYKLEKLNKTEWKSYIEGREFTSGSSFIMVNSEKGRENDIELIGATENEIDFIAESKDNIQFLLTELKKLQNKLSKKHCS